MSNEYSTALKLGATAPFALIMKLTHKERGAFINVVSPNLLPAFKHALLRGI